jgi:hypothetical protein
MNFRRPQHDDENTSVPSYREAISHPATRQILMVHGLTLICLSVGVSLIPNYLEDFRHVSPSVISILSAGAAVGTALFAVITARSRKLQTSPLTAAAIATVFVVAGLVIMAVFSPLPFIAVAYLFRGGLFSAWVLFISAASLARVHRARDPRWRRHVVRSGTLRAALQRRSPPSIGRWRGRCISHGCDDPACRSSVATACPAGVRGGVDAGLSAQVRPVHRARATIASANCDGRGWLDPARFRMVFTHTEIA